MGIDHGQCELTLIRHAKLSVDALTVGFDRAQAQVHVPGDHRELFAVEDLLDDLEFPPGETQLPAHSLPVHPGEERPAVIGTDIANPCDANSVPSLRCAG